jgi:hypothetical protein
MIHRRYKALPGRDGVDDPGMEVYPLIGPGLCKILDPNFREHLFSVVGE